MRAFQVFDCSPACHYNYFNLFIFPFLSSIGSNQMRTLRFVNLLEVFPQIRFVSSPLCKAFRGAFSTDSAAFKLHCLIHEVTFATPEAFSLLLWKRKNDQTIQIVTRFCGACVRMLKNAFRGRHQLANGCAGQRKRLHSSKHATDNTQTGGDHLKDTNTRWARDTTHSERWGKHSQQWVTLGGEGGEGIWSTFSEAREYGGTLPSYFPEMIPQASGDHVMAPTPGDTVMWWAFTLLSSHRLGHFQTSIQLWHLGLFHTKNWIAQTCYILKWICIMWFSAINKALLSVVMW